MSDELTNLTDMVNNPQEPMIAPADIGLMRVKTANEWMEEAASRPDPRPLWDCLWNEGEVCCLFADSNLGKSLYAVQIANEIAKTEKVVYFDFELSDKQFQLRYTDKQTNTLYQFPDNFLRSEMNVEQYCEGDFEDEVLKSIEQLAIQLSVKVLIIDNLTWLCNTSEKGDSAGILMQNLMTLKKRHGWSILVIAHTPKRSLSSPITQNDLAGSKKLFNFFDSVFAIGQSAQDTELKYIKQLKVRAGAFKYNADNVMSVEIINDGAFTKFRTIGYGAERKHLQDLSDKDRDTQAQQVRELQAKGKTYREIGQELGISAAKVCRLLK